MSGVVKVSGVDELKDVLEYGAVSKGDFVHVELTRELVDYLFGKRRLNPREYKEVHAKSMSAKWSIRSNANVEIFRAEHFNAILSLVTDPSTGEEEWTLVRGQHTLGALGLCDESVYEGKWVVVSIGDGESGLTETSTRNQGVTDKANVLATHLRQSPSKIKSAKRAIHGIATAFASRKNSNRISGSDFVEQVSWFLNNHEDLFDAMPTSPNTWKFTKKRGKQVRRVCPAFASSLALLWHFHNGKDFGEAYEEIMGYNLFANVDESKGQHVLLWCVLQEVADSVQGINVKKKLAYRGEGHLRYAFKALLACLDGKGDQDSVHKDGCLSREKLRNEDGSQYEGKGYTFVGSKPIDSEWNGSYAVGGECIRFVSSILDTYGV